MPKEIAMCYTTRITDEKMEDLRDELLCLVSNAVDRSISHTEIVHVDDFRGDLSGLLELLEELPVNKDLDIEWVEVDGKVDCWACDPAGENMLWRLLVTVCG